MIKIKSDLNDPMTENVIHRMLVASEKLQRLPVVVVFGLMVILAAAVFGIWQLRAADAALMSAVLVLIVSLLNWLLLWLLPRMNLSYGPDKPSALALACLTALVFIGIGVVGLPVWVNAVVGLMIIGVVFYSTWIEPFRLGITHEKYAFSGWDAGHPPLKLLHIGDIHVERITKRERKLNAFIADLQPDVIVFSGDFVNVSHTYDDEAYKAIRAFISEWRAPHGVYCVSGTYTVEPIARVREFVAGLDHLRLLENEIVCIETPSGKLNITGMITTHHLEQDRETICALSKAKPAEGLNLLLTHAPDVAPEADNGGYDLYLCGHTHGGQIRFPLIGAVFSGSALGKDFVIGRRQLNHMTLYTTRGVGLEGMGAPRARFLCPPEVILWEITGQP